jgi:hypothetical protein
LAAFALLSGVVFGGFGASAAVSAAVSVDDESAFVARVAEERSAAGVPGYAVAPDLVEVARGQAARMASEHRLYHNPSLGSEVSGWVAVGENVGVGATVDDIHRAFMESATHRHAILSTEFTEVGVGVEVDGDGALWVAQVFRRPEASSGSSGVVRAAGAGAAPRAPRASAAVVVDRPSPPAAPPVAAPAPVVTTTTVPAPPPEDPAAPALVTSVATSFERTALGAAALRPLVVPAVATVDREVTAPVAVAASLLLLVVLRLLVEVAGRYPAAVSVWRRQRNQASISSSRSPSSTAWTLPVS